tara:strand:+ start:335 stop:517 length:183 start_codon:yes stop_codon:yes gene_type:complete
MMSRKHYIAVADIINDCWNQHYIDSEEDFTAVVNRFGEMFSDDNPNFDFIKFSVACYKAK